MISAVEKWPVEKLQQDFMEVFGRAPGLLARSPGRVNIIGEHTDYNDGFVLPAAIDKAIYVAVEKREDDKIMLYSVDFKETYETRLKDIQPTRNWATYVLGAINELVAQGHAITGLNLALDGDIPIGAGLSSSAAVESAVLFALDQLYGLHLHRLEMVKMAQRAEHRFSGVRCGIMDMFASIMGKKDHVIKLDCRSLEYEYKPFCLDGYRLLLLNTNVKHSLASSEYNNRREECEQGVAWVREKHAGVTALRDVTMSMLDEFVKPKDMLVYRRCRFVVGEIGRLLGACEDLDRGNLDALGRKMFATHDGLSKDYEVSCPEADYLVEAVRGLPEVLGARMMGGGFGGCTINIVKEAAIPGLIERMTAGYGKDMNKELTAYVANIDNGSEVIKLKY